jgi:acyl carrier protein
VGLDTVELALSVEQTFQIEIPDSVAGNIRTVGDLHEFVVSELIRLNRPNINRDIVFDLLRNLICMQLGVNPDEVIASARFVEDLRAD